MGIISTFELLVKPIAPRDPIPEDFRAVARRVVQGYFLTITNLSNLDLRFRFRFTASSVNATNVIGASGPGSFVNQVDLLYDIDGSENLPLENVGISATGPGFVRIRGDLPSLRGNQTATVQLLPRLTRSVLENEDPELEIRGFADVFIPLIASANEDGGFSLIRQTDESVPVLLQPEIRGTFLPNDLSTNNIDFDQINYTLMTASGRAFEEIEPPAALVPAPVTPELLDTVVEDLRTDPAILDRMSEEPDSQLRDLLINLFNLEPSAENLTRISNTLNEIGIPIVMQPSSS